MRNILLSLLSFICIDKTYGQTSIRAGHIVAEITIEKRTILTKVEVKSSVPLTDSGWVQNLEKNITRSIRSGKRPPKGKYIVSVRFITDKQGNAADVICEKDPGFGMCEHVAGIVKKSPKWGPASSRSALKSHIDSANVRYTPSSDLLPDEFNVAAMENEYYCDAAANFSGHIFVLRLRDNHACTYETYYKPYNFARIAFRIGNYRISGDTIFITYKSLLEGKADQIYLQPTLSVSWISPRAPEFLLLKKNRLYNPYIQRHFYTLTDKPQFDLKSQE